MLIQFRTISGNFLAIFMFQKLYENGNAFLKSFPRFVQTADYAPYNTLISLCRKVL